MGIYVDYALYADCGEETLRKRLETVRLRCLDLPLRAVGEVRRIAPVCNPVVLRLFQGEGHAFPEAIAQRLRQIEGDADHGELCLCFAPMVSPELPKRQLRRFFAPVLELLEQTDLWKTEELPEEIQQATPWGFTILKITRKGIELEFANILLRYGYLLILDPGEGSETVALALSTFRQPEGSRRSRRPPLWYGQGFTKTQYATEFVQVHETVCRVLDIAREEGLLLKGSDNCGYFASRSWEDASKRVNEELLFARMVSGLVGVTVGNLREEGVQVHMLQDNAAKASPVDFSAALAREQASGG
jgi:hypothetical protein